MILEFLFAAFLIWWWFLDNEFRQPSFFGTIRVANYNWSFKVFNKMPSLIKKSYKVKNIKIFFADEKNIILGAIKSSTNKYNIKNYRFIQENIESSDFDIYEKVYEIAYKHTLIDLQKMYGMSWKNEIDFKFVYDNYSESLTILTRIMYQNKNTRQFNVFENACENYKNLSEIPRDMNDIYKIYVRLVPFPIERFNAGIEKQNIYYQEVKLDDIDTQFFINAKIQLSY